MDELVEGASGFIYYVSVRGITGTKSAEIAEVEAQVARILARSGLPIAVGFDQGKMIRPLGGGGAQGFSQRTVGGQIGGGSLHQSRESTRSARVRKSVTPWSS